MKSVTTQRAGLFLGILFFILSNSAGAGDPGNPDTAYLESGGITGTTLLLKVKFVTDNVGDSNKIRGFGFPLLITNSNPAAKPVLDTTLSTTYSGSAVASFAFISTYVVPKIDSIICDTFTTCSTDPDGCLLPPRSCYCINDTTLCCIDSITCDTFQADRVRTFPLQYVLGAFNVDASSPSNIGAGRYLYANIVLRLQDTTTICIDTQSTPTVILGFNTVASGSYTPQWRDGCCQADFSYKRGDVNCSGGNGNLADVTYLTNYIFKGGPPPCLKKLGDVNCSGGNPNLQDMIYLINYIFKGGPSPCPF